MSAKAIILRKALRKARAKLPLRRLTVLDVARLPFENAETAKVSSEAVAWFLALSPADRSAEIMRAYMFKTQVGPLIDFSFGRKL